MTIIIGIDPGSRLTGYGLIRKTGSKCEFIDAGTIRTDTEEMPLRLKRIYEGLKRIIDFYQPTEASVEQVFMARNPDSALKLGQARGAAVTALMVHNVAVSEYSARQIKQAVVGVGSAEKEQVQAMVTRLCVYRSFPKPTLPMHWPPPCAMPLPPRPWPGWAQRPCAEAVHAFKRVT